MKKFKRVLSLIMALAMSMSLTTITFAEGETTEEIINPEIWLYRDYEDYTGGRQIFNPDGSYGRKIFSANRNSFLDSTKSVNGIDGKGVTFGTSSNGAGYYKNPVATCTELIKTGKIYVSFDIKRKSDDYFASVGVTESSNFIAFGNKVSSTYDPQYLTFYTGSSESQKVFESPEVMGDNGIYRLGNIPAGYQKIDVVFDLDANTVTTYINGEQFAIKTGQTTNLSAVLVYLSHGIEYLDNLTMVYYPSKVSAQTFSLKGNETSIEDGTIDIEFVSDAVDNYVQTTTDETTGETTTTTTVYKAPYRVSLTDAASLAGKISVKNAAGTAVEVESVTKGDKPGTYKIKLADGIDENESYIVSANTGLTDILGATLNPNAASVAVTHSGPQVWMYRDYEEYTGGPGVFNPDAEFGREALNDGGAFIEEAMPVKAINGKGAGMPSASAGSGSGTWTIIKDTEPLTTGKFYVAFDMKRKSDEYFTDANGNPTGLRSIINFMRGTSKGKNVVLNIGHTDYSGEYMTGSHILHNLDHFPAENQKIEVIFDLDNNLVTSYVNGVQAAESPNTYNIVRLQLSINNGYEYIDNLAVVYYPQGTEGQTFSMRAQDVSYKNDTISVAFLSDVEDRFATASGGKVYKAPYGVTLTDDSNLADAIVVTNAAGDEVAVESVVKGDKTGEYEIKLADEVEVGECYTVTVMSDFTDILGASLGSPEVQIKALEGSFNASIEGLYVGDGKISTPEEIKAGGKLSAKINYTNTTEADKALTGIVAYYDADGRLISTEMADSITAYETSAEITEKIEFTAPEDMSGICGVKAFAWDFETLKPLTANYGIFNDLWEGDGAFSELFAQNLVTTFYGDEGTTRGFAWSAKRVHADMVIRYAKEGEDWENESITKAAEYTEYEGRYFYEVDIDNLEPGETYVYKIGDLDDEVWSETYTFTTEPENVTEFSFAGIADMQGSAWSSFAYAQKTVQGAFKDDPNLAFMVNLGDMVNTGTSQSEWDLFFKTIEGYAESVPFMTVVGNHDVLADPINGGKLCALQFNNPKNGVNALGDITADDVTHDYFKSTVNNFDDTAYSFDYGNAHFVVLNTGSDKDAADKTAIVTEQAKWLEEDLKATDKKWKIVMLHIGMYPARINRYDTRAELTEVIDKYGVDLVLSGHDHMVTRTYPMRNKEIVTTENPASVTKGTGMINAILGSAGRKRYAEVTNIPSYFAVLKATSGTQPTYSLFNVSEEKISVVTKQINGTIVDSFEIVD